MVCKYFLQVWSLPSHCLNRVFHKEKLLILIMSNLLGFFFFIMDHVFGVISKNLRYNNQFPGPKGFSPMCVCVCGCFLKVFSFYI